ncbi:hypothetical protein L7F22_049208 [Adiantum nelumboides]|nr:hypothetical protein [Adiantum nelumboides]
MANKPSNHPMSGGSAGHEQSRLPIHNTFLGNLFNSPLFPSNHEHDKVDQGLKSMNMSNMFNPGGSNVYENPAFVSGQNGENKGDFQGDFSPHKDHCKSDDQNHNVSYEDDEDGPSMVIPVFDLENWGSTLNVDDVVKGVVSTSSSDGEEDSIPNTQIVDKDNVDESFEAQQQAQDNVTKSQMLEDTGGPTIYYILVKRRRLRRRHGPSHKSSRRKVLLSLPSLAIGLVESHLDNFKSL